MRAMSSLIIITGCPGTGKSHLAGMLRNRFPGLTSLSYDSFKEANWDKYGFDSAAEKAALNRRSLAEFYDAVAACLRAGDDVLIEYPFNQSHVPALRRILAETGARAFTLYLHGDMEVLYRRSVDRDDRDHRHPGHLYSAYHKGVAPGAEESCRLTYDEFIADCGRKDYDIRLGECVSMDVTDLSAIDYDAAFEALEARAGLTSCPAPEEGERS